MSSSVVARCLVEGRQQFPDIATDDAAIEAQIAALVADGDEEPTHPGDVFLAAAAAIGDAGATRRVHDRLAAVAGRASRTLLSRSDLDDVVQEVAIRVLAGRPGTPPQINSYRGAGPLDAWLRVVVLRAALSARRKQQTAKVEEPLDDTSWLELSMVLDDPRALSTATRGRIPELRRTFEEAIAALAPKQRIVLRQHFLDGSSTEQLGRMYGVHRVTVFRWITEAKEAVLEYMRERLAALLGGGETDIASIMRGLASNFSVSLVRVLEDPPADQP